MSNVKQVLSSKDQSVWSITSQQTVFEAIQLMADKRIGALLVIDKDRLEGIISERDYAREIILKGRSSRETPIADIMTSRVVTITPAHRVQDALSVMTDNRIRHLPVMDGNRVIGIVSIGDLVKSVISELEWTIEQLENYIKG